MLSPLANGFVLAVFGLVLGAGISIFGQLTGLRAIPTREAGESFWAGVLRRQREEDRLLANLPRSALLTEVALVVLSGVLVVLLFFSPVRMRWVPFLIAMGAGYASIEALYAVSKSRAVRPLDWLAGRVFREPQEPKRHDGSAAET